jgi:hypothetical protein
MSIRWFGRTAPALRGGARAYSWLVSALLPLLFAGVALAQDAAEERSTSFQAVQGAVKEDVPGGPLLVWAYGLILLLLVGYMVRIALLQQRSDRELQRLAQQLGKTGS